MTDGNEPIWAVIAPLPEGELRARVAALWPRVAGHPAPEIEWQFTGGDAGWSAAFTAEADALVTGEEELAAALADRLDREVYLLFFDLDEAEVIPHLVYRYAPGAEPSGTEDDPHALAERLGIELPGRPAPHVVRSVGGALVEGVSPDDVREALGDEIDPEVVRITAVALGAFVHGSRGVGNVGFRLAELFPGARIYEVMQHRETGLFACTVFEDGEEVGELLWPPDDEEPDDEEPDDEEDVPRLHEIRGARDPDAILEALGIAELVAAGSGQV